MSDAGEHPEKPIDIEYVERAVENLGQAKDPGTSQQEQMALLAEAQVCATLAVLVRVSESGVQLSEMSVQIARICDWLEER